ncbi:zinc finger protein 62 [Silurus meridionalis]|uniref:C2H2-type domain-containing protein n=1 Tax=Silurus meridionalis TaxID=175797 RepID=A0A8T0B436_SILME|nr:zinc finger protein 62 [Silurus meridionalis]XP_046718113.1 zinc finger protein 62 [Silurus meridionalis]XP_046718114.1 zinc finger protein 62 [Silurus meridionalis]KAF7700295.1 hypothetical protein HF521_003253 [Silurus meridionalis]
MEQCKLKMGIQDRVKDSEGERSSPNIYVEDSDSRKKIPFSDEVSLSSSLESPLTHFDHEKSQRVTNLSPPPQKAPMSITIATPTASREPISSTSVVAQTPSFHWPSVNPSHHMVLAYTDFMAFQHMVACSYPTPMYPFLQHPLQRQMPSSLVGYTDLLHPHPHILRSRPFDRPLVPELKRKTDLINAMLPGAPALQEKERKSKVQSDKERHCRHCNKTIVENPWRQSTRSASSGLEELLYECKFCQRGIREKRSLRSLRRGHGGEKPYQCKHCNKRFSLKHQLDTHLRVHTGEKPFECRLCGQRSRDYSAMIKHLRTHGGATPYQCTLCLEFCSSLVTMQKHLKGHPTQDFPPNWSLSSTYLYICHA